jgi:hypothetical protein
MGKDWRRAMFVLFACYPFYVLPVLIVYMIWALLGLETLS